MAHELTILQAARMKGRLSPELAAASTGLDVDAASAVLAELRGAGLVKGEPSVRLTPEGRERLATLVAAEREGIYKPALSVLY